MNLTGLPAYSYDMYVTCHCQTNSCAGSTTRAKQNQNQLEIWGRTQREGAGRCKSRGRPPNFGIQIKKSASIPTNCGYGDWSCMTVKPCNRLTLLGPQIWRDDIY